MKVYKHRIKIDFDDIFLAVVLVCCAWGKIEWYWFWGLLFLMTCSAGYWGKDKEL